MKINNILKLILLFVFYSQYSFAQHNLSVIPPVQIYEQNDMKIQVPLLINNTTQENSQKIEEPVSQEVKTPSLVSKKNVLPASEASEPDFKSFLDKKKFLKENKSEPSLWQGASLVIGFISLLGIIAFIMTKFNRKGLFKNIKNDKAMNIISTLAISPKRQVMLIQIRDKEIVISNTENGINFITDIGNSTSMKEIPVEKKPFQISDFIKSLPTNEKQVPEAENKTVVNEKKSDILVKALKRMENKPEQQDKVPKNDSSTQETIEPSGKFPKYFSNIFENEAKKEVKKKEEPDSVENVTNLIREKLRSMKPLS